MPQNNDFILSQFSSLTLMWTISTTHLPPCICLWSRANVHIHIHVKAIKLKLGKTVVNWMKANLKLNWSDRHEPGKLQAISIGINRKAHWNIMTLTTTPDNHSHSQVRSILACDMSTYTCPDLSRPEHQLKQCYSYGIEKNTVFLYPILFNRIC